MLTRHRCQATCGSSVLALVVGTAEDIVMGVVEAATVCGAGGTGCGGGALQAALLGHDVPRGHDVLHQVRLALCIQPLIATDTPHRLLLAHQQAQVQSLA